MAYRDYRAPGVSVIVERQQGEKTSSSTKFFPVYVGTGMTSNSRTVEFDKVTADTSDFPNVTFNVSFDGIISSDLYALTDFTLSSISTNKTETPRVLVKDTDYSVITGLTSLRSDGQGSFTVAILDATLTDTDLVYSFDFNLVNGEDDFDLRLVLNEDVFYSQHIVGPYQLTENGVTISNDIAIAAEIAFRTKVPAFFYLEVPRAYGAKAAKADIIDAIEKIYYKKDAYHIVPLTDDVDVAAAVKSFATAVSNPLDQREVVGFVNYPPSLITDINDIVELVDKVGGYSVSLNSSRMNNVFGGKELVMTLGNVDTRIPFYFMNVAITALDVTVGMAAPLSKREITVFKTLIGPRFRPQVWNKLATQRVMIVTQSDSGQPIVIRHQLTTSQSDAAEDQEYSLVKNVDAVSILFRERLDPYSGKYNITDGYLEKLDGATSSVVEEAKETGLVRNLTQLQPWSVRVIPDPSGQEKEQRNLITRWRLVPAYPANNLDVYLLI